MEKKYWPGIGAINLSQIQICELFRTEPSGPFHFENKTLGSIEDIGSQSRFYNGIRL